MDLFSYYFIDFARIIMIISS